MSPTTQASDTYKLKQLLQDTYAEALHKNEQSSTAWADLKQDHVSVQQLLDKLPHKLSHEVMVPVGPRALMPGKMVHTNEFLVCLGDGWFVERSAKEAAEICDRRIKMCEEMLEKLEKERSLLASRKQLPLEEDVFGSISGNEIVEEYDEANEAVWREQHRQKECEYRKRLAEFREKEKTTISDEESLWKRLDELELQEELEEELDRLHTEEDEDDDDDDDDGDEENEYDGETEDEDDRTSGAVPVNLKTMLPSVDRIPAEASKEYEKKVHTSNRRVSFSDRPQPKEDDVSSEDEPLYLNFRHSPEVTQKPAPVNLETPQSPADIYNRFKASAANIGLKSILKNKHEVQNNLEVQASSSQKVEWDDHQSNRVCSTPESSMEPANKPAVFGDVMEHQPENAIPTTEPLRPVSRFRAARLARR